MLYCKKKNDKDKYNCLIINSIISEKYFINILFAHLINYSYLSINQANPGKSFSDNSFFYFLFGFSAFYVFSSVLCPSPYLSLYSRRSLCSCPKPFLSSN